MKHHTLDQMELYWLPRAKIRAQQAWELGRYTPIDPRWPDLCFESDDRRYVKKTIQMLDELPGKPWPDWIIAQVRLEWTCKTLRETGRLK